jgi:hypothetical protein
MPKRSIDEIEYPVEAILKHKGRKCNLQTMKFLVKWAGFGTKENTWEPFDGLKEVGIFHEYLKSRETLYSLLSKCPKNRFEEVNTILVKRFFDSFDQAREDKKQLINTHKHYLIARGVIEDWIKRIGKTQVLDAIYMKMCATATTEYAIYVGFRLNDDIKYLRMLASTAERILLDYGKSVVRLNTKYKIKSP